MSFHGGLSCRLEVAFADELCRELGVRLIAPDRPGIGLSDFAPGRSLLDWPHDVETLADALGLERFAVMGWSAGGPYALACAYCLGERLTAVASVAGMAPLDSPAGIDALGMAVDRILFRVTRRRSGVAGRLLSLARFGSRAMVRRSLLQSLRWAGDADAEFVAALPGTEIADSFLESLRQGGHGTAHDYHLLGGDWGFPLAAVKTEVLVWQGRGDGLVPPAQGQRLTEALPRARLRFFDGYGHFLPRRCTRELLLALL